MNDPNKIVRIRALQRSFAAGHGALVLGPATLPRVTREKLPTKVSVERPVHISGEKRTTRRSATTPLAARLLSGTLSLLLMLNPLFVAYAVEEGALPEGIPVEESVVPLEPDPIPSDEVVPAVVPTEVEEIVSNDTNDSEPESSNDEASGSELLPTDDVVTEEGSEEEVVPVDMASTTSEEVVANTSINDEIVASSSTASTIPSGIATSSKETATSSTDTASTNDDGEASQGNVSGGNGGGGEVASTTETVVGTSTTESATSSMATSTDMEGAATSTDAGGEGSSTTIEDIATTTPPVEFHLSDSDLVFSKTDCMETPEGGYYCVPKGAAGGAIPEYNESPQGVRDVSLRVGIDADGDKEIYLREGIDETKISNNVYDDTNPVYDEVSGYVVWQTLVSERWQIFAFDTASRTTRQLTSTSYNNSDPHINDGRVAWQAWIDNNWEIFTIADVRVSPANAERVTWSYAPDMFPQVRGDLISWQMNNGTEWRVVVKNLLTGELTDVSGADGVRYENPRFVLVFEGHTDDGTVKRIGYDITSGETMELGTNGRNLPTEPIPEAPTQEQSEAVPPSATTTTSIKKTQDEPEAGE